MEVLTAHSVLLFRYKKTFQDLLAPNPTSVTTSTSARPLGDGSVGRWPLPGAEGAPDHIIPVALGGATSAQNPQLLCAGCNRKKGANLYCGEPGEEGENDESDQIRRWSLAKRFMGICPRSGIIPRGGTSDDGSGIVWPVLRA